MGLGTGKVDGSEGIYFREGLVELGLVEGEFVAELGLVAVEEVKDAEQGHIIEGGTEDKFNH